MRKKKTPPADLIPILRMEASERPEALRITFALYDPSGAVYAPATAMFIVPRTHLLSVLAGNKITMTGITRERAAQIAADKEKNNP